MPAIPGIPSNGEPAYDQFADSFTAYVYLTSPSVMFCVDSDDGFLLSLSTTVNPSDAFNRHNLGSFQGGRGYANSFMQANISSNGFYALRLDFEQGGGNANVELFTILTNGQAVLVNDTNNPLATLAYPAPERFQAKLPSSSASHPSRLQCLTGMSHSQRAGQHQPHPSGRRRLRRHQLLCLQDQWRGTVATNGSSTLVVTNAPIYTPSGNPIEATSTPSPICSRPTPLSCPTPPT